MKQQNFSFVRIVTRVWFMASGQISTYRIHKNFLSLTLLLNDYQRSDGRLDPLRGRDEHRFRAIYWLCRRRREARMLHLRTAVALAARSKLVGGYSTQTVVPNINIKRLARDWHPMLYHVAGSVGGQITTLWRIGCPARANSLRSIFGIILPRLLLLIGSTLKIANKNVGYQNKEF